MTTSTQQAQIQYWRERLRELRARLTEQRTLYAEARAAGEAEEELRRIKEHGEKLAERVANGEDMIEEAEDEEIAAIADEHYDGCVGCATESEGGLCKTCQDENDSNAFGNTCHCSAPDVLARQAECPVHPEPEYGPQDGDDVFE
jgi:DNA repair exonuclease SbcCD ATPase subunit